jgi:hypothetical protein
VVEVLWPDDDLYYPGRISAYHPATRKHTVTYDADGATEDLELWAPTEIVRLKARR